MENMTTTVSGRVVVLVRAQDKNAFGGMIHGQSSSGLAYYVEPSSFVADNNEISSLMIRNASSFVLVEKGIKEIKVKI